jgi:hypothetical protein
MTLNPDQFKDLAMDRTDPVVTHKGVPLQIHVKTGYSPPKREDGSEYFGGTVEAFHKGRSVGAMGVGFGSGRTVQIGDLEVVRHARRRGVATAMVDHARSLGIPVEHHETLSNYSPAGRAFRAAHEAAK